VHGRGQIWDISDKENPRTIARVHNPNVEFFHSAAFSWDGRTVIYGDEAGGGTGPRCRQQDPDTLGALWFYDVGSLDTLDGTTVEPELSHFKVPRIQGDLPNCTMHNFNTLPTMKRNVLGRARLRRDEAVRQLERGRQEAPPLQPADAGRHPALKLARWRPGATRASVSAQARAGRRRRRSARTPSSAAASTATASAPWVTAPAAALNERWKA